MTLLQAARLEVEALRDFLDMDNCQPGRLIDRKCSPLYWIMNQMLYDKFHGNGWELDLLAGIFVKQKGK